MEAKKIEIESRVLEKSNEYRKTILVNSNRTVYQPTKLIDKNKVFAIYENRKMIEPLRKELKNRGWTEKIVKDIRKLSTIPGTERIMKTSLLIPTFIWLSRYNGLDIEGSPMISRLTQKSFKNFCFKDILVNYDRENKSNIDDDESVLNVPRTFKLFENEKESFLEDYRMTAYSSFIRFLHTTGSAAFSPTGKITSKWIDHAIENLETAIAVCIDDQPPDENVKPTMEKKPINHTDFRKFKICYQSVVKCKSKIKASREAVENFLKKCRRIYDKCKEVWSYFENDGFYNLWLLKPARRSLGIGIKLFDDDNDILVHVFYNKEMKYLVQKYIG